MARHLSKRKAIKRHRELWNKIADMTEELGRPVDKREALDALGYRYNVRSDCWCCEYTKNGPGCKKCPIDWGNGITCNLSDSPFHVWVDLVYRYNYSDYGIETGYLKNINGLIVGLARDIANLPERKNRRWEMWIKNIFNGS